MEGMARVVLAAMLLCMGTSRDHVRRVSEWNLGKERLAIQGYDPVAYFPEGGGVPIKGDSGIATEYRGAVYRFATGAHLSAFLSDPAHYEPAYGGWCAYGMLKGVRDPIDPKSFIVKDDRLFLFYKGRLGDMRFKWFTGDHDAEVKVANDVWRQMSGE
jgi:YHS domain-containing protein